ncbi:MAG: bacillithiol biosynthesis cysteine-adding enzyme BshC [Planctomycetota bacterium]
MIQVHRVAADDRTASPFVRLVREGEAGTLGLSVPHRAEEFEPPASLLESSERAAIAMALERGLAPLEPHVAVLDAARALAEPDACAVVTGQQPGFLASPLYSLYKALQALALAQVLRERFRVPVIALFWNHADDHDVAEVHHTHLVNRNLDLQKISLPGLSSGRQPFSRILLDEEKHHLTAVRALLAQMLEGSPHAREAVDLFAPRSGESLARAFTRTMTGLLGPAGLVVLEPDWIRPQMSAQLARIVAQDPVSFLQRGAARMSDRGLTPAIEPSDAAIVFRHEPEGRLAVRGGGDGFRFDGEQGSRTGTELAAEIVQDPLSWSPGALLRPIVQDLCLPVAAYVGGWGELAYHAELGDLRARVEAPITPIVPRVSCTLVDPECRLSLAKLGLEIDAVVHAGLPASAPVPAPDAPPWLARIRQITDAAARDLESMRPGVNELDPSLLSQLKRTSDQVRSAGDWLAEKVERVHQNKSGKGRRHIRRLNSWLRPRDELQERVLGPLPFVARFGEDWPLELAHAMNPLSSDHLVIHLGQDSGGDGS